MKPFSTIIIKYAIFYIIIKHKRWQLDLTLFHHDQKQHNKVF